MNNKQRWLAATIAAVSLASIPSVSLAKVDLIQALKLQNELTPFGAERKGNEEGTIPAWTGGITQWPEGYKGSGQHHIDPFADDKELFTITAQNYKEYADKLTPGLQAMFEAHPDTFKMKVFPSRRSHSAPQWVYNRTYENATTAELIDSGNGFVNAIGGIPFPIPQNGLEMIWNHIIRFRGSYFERTEVSANVQRNGSYTLTGSNTQTDFTYYNQDKTLATLDNRLFNFLRVTTAPARVAGEAILVHEPIDQVKEPRQAWQYTAGLRRVRRAPTLAYDTPIGDGILTTDNFDMYNGSPDRFEWKIVGKKEMYIPYNSYALESPEVTYEQVLQPGHIAADLPRYELHRVWELQATLKGDERHVYSSQTLYIEEDSWNVVLKDSFDKRGDLWRVHMGYTKNQYELPATVLVVEVHYDLKTGRYSIFNMTNEERETTNYAKTSPGDSFFQPATLRRRGRR